jgi:hypothetical protein
MPNINKISTFSSPKNNYRFFVARKLSTRHLKEYHLFGAPMPGRNFNGNSYKYGMNGQLKDDEIFNGAYSAEFWEYDSRTGRRWNRDPVVHPWESSYACFANNPIFYSDVKGDEAEGWEPKKGGGYTYNPDPSKGKETADWTGGDINGHSYEVHGNKEGSLEVTFHAVDIHPVKTEEERFAYSRNTSRIMNQFSKGFLIGAIALPSAVVAVEAGAFSFIGKQLGWNIGGGLADILNQTVIQNKSADEFNYASTVTNTIFGGKNIVYSALLGSSGNLINATKTDLKKGTVFSISTSNMISYSAGVAGNIFGNLHMKMVSTSGFIPNKVMFTGFETGVNLLGNSISNSIETEVKQAK